MEALKALKASIDEEKLMSDKGDVERLLVKYLEEDEGKQLSEFLSKTEDEGGPNIYDILSIVIYESITDTCVGSPPLKLFDLCEFPTKSRLVCVFVDYLERNDQLEIINTVRFGDGEGVTFLDNAASYGCSDTVKVLLDAGADHALARDDGLTPLHMACNYGHLAVVTLLLGNGANTEQADNDGQTPLICACQHGHNEETNLIVKVLLCNGADSNKTDLSDLSPIYFACQLGLDLVVSTLLAYNANVMVIRCPIQIALDTGHKSCAELIRTWPARRNQVMAKLCLDKLRKQGYYDVVRRTANNDLPKHLFVFKVVEMMKSCCMYGLADTLIEYVGVGEPLEDLPV